MLRQVFDIIGMPFYAAQIVTGRKAFQGNPLIASERLNRRGLHVWRSRTAGEIAERRRRKLRHLIADADRAAFERDGFVEKRDLLDADTFAALLAEIRGLDEPAREMVEGRAVTRRIEITPAMTERMPALRRLLETQEWRGLTRYVGGFDAEPIVCVQTIIGAVAEGGPDADPQTRLHMDTFHPTMKAWFFLEDVDPEEGPLTYVAGSHLPTRRRMAWQKRMSVKAAREKKGGSFRLPEADLPLLRLPQRTRFAVPGNTLVVADTFGFHARGRSLRPSTRVEIYASMRPNPFNPMVALDTALVPFVSGRKLAIGWWFEDLMVRLGLARQVWRPVGRVNPWAPPASLRPDAPGRRRSGKAASAA